MKHHCLVIIGLFISLNFWAQTPFDGIPYQTVLRNAFGDPLGDTTIQLTFQLRHGNTNGQIIYSESQVLLTNNLGLASTEIGDGDPNIGIFSEIDWSLVPIYLEVVMNGNSQGVSELNTVPYALLAKKAQSVNVQLSTNGDTLMVGDTLIAVSQFNSGLNGTGELLNDQSGMIQSSSLNISCGSSSTSLPFLNIKACDLDSLENMYFLLEYSGEHNFYGMHLNCEGNTAYRLCKINKYGTVVWWTPISSGTANLRDAFLTATYNGYILLAANSDGISNGTGAYPFSIQLSETTLSFTDRSKFLILFDPNGHYLDHENIPGNYTIQHISGNSSGYLAINENAIGQVSVSIIGMRMYQFNNNNISLLWNSTAVDWNNCSGMQIDPNLPIIHCITTGSYSPSITGYWNSYNKIQGSTILLSRNVFKSTENLLNSKFSLLNNTLIIDVYPKNTQTITVKPMIGANATGTFITIKYNFSSNDYTIVNNLETNSLSSILQSTTPLMVSKQFSNLWFINSLSWVINTGGVNFFRGSTILKKINPNNYSIQFYTLNSSFRTLNDPFLANKIVQVAIMNDTIHLIGNYACNEEGLNLLDRSFPSMPGRSRYPFVLKINLTP